MAMCCTMSPRAVAWAGPSAKREGQVLLLAIYCVLFRPPQHIDTTMPLLVRHRRAASTFASILVMIIGALCPHVHAQPAQQLGARGQVGRLIVNHDANNDEIFVTATGTLAKPAENSTTCRPVRDSGNRACSGK